MIYSDDRDAWLAARMNGVGGSDVAAMLGENEYCTREQLAMEKAGLAEPFAGNEATELGSAMEPTIAAIANARFGWRLERHGAIVVDSVEPLLQCTPDYTMPTPYGMAAVQIKFTACQPTEACKPRKDGSPSTAAFANGPPIRYQLQLNAEMAVLGYEHGVLLVLHLQPMALRAYYVPRHNGVIARIRNECPVFWAEVTRMKEGRVAV